MEHNDSVPQKSWKFSDDMDERLRKHRLGAENIHQPLREHACDDDISGNALSFNFICVI